MEKNSANKPFIFFILNFQHITLNNIQNNFFFATTGISRTIRDMIPVK